VQGLYLYGIRESLDRPFPLAAKGIDGKQEVFTIACQGLEAVVSKVSLEEFDSRTIQIKAQEDLNWIKEKAFAHERVVEEAMRKKDKILSLIPMSFGIIFKERARLEECLNKDYSKIKEVLDRIRGKEEWGVKVYLKDKNIFEQRIKEGSKAIKKKAKEIASLPEGLAYFMEEELKEVICKEMNRELNNMIEVFFEGLKRGSVASVKNKILGKELTGKREPMILNAAYLILEEEIEGFKKEAGDLNRRMEGEGFYLEFSGPWPAYNFTSY